MIIFIILSIISLIITFPYEENDEETDTKDNNKENKKNNKKNGSLKEALCSMKNLMMVSFCFCGFCKYDFKWYIKFFYSFWFLNIKLQ